MSIPVDEERDPDVVIAKALSLADELLKQNAALVEALSGSDELIDRLKGHFGDWWGGSKIAHKTVEIQQANRQALALAEGDE